MVKDSTSHLENEYAVSDARINPDGTLFHSLVTKPREIEVSFQKPVVTKDSERTHVVYKMSVQKVKVEKPKTWWEQTKSYGFYVLVILTLWRYRKRLWKLISAIKI